MSGVPGVNTFCVLVSNAVSLPRDILVPGGGTLVDDPFNIPEDCELLVFLPELPDLFVSMGLCRYLGIKSLYGVILREGLV